MSKIFYSLTFWTLVAGLAAFVARFFNPAFPLDQLQILDLVLFALGLIGVVPMLRVKGVQTVNILNSLPFWQLIAGLIGFVVHFYQSGFPFDVNVIAGMIIFVLGYFGIHPELRVRKIL